MAEKAISTLPLAAETPTAFSVSGHHALPALAAEIRADRVVSSMHHVDAEFCNVAALVPELYNDAISELQRAASSPAKDEDEASLQIVFSRIAGLLLGTQSSNTDPVIWLMVHKAALCRRSGPTARAVAVRDAAMFLLSEYLDVESDSARAAA